MESMPLILPILPIPAAGHRAPLPEHAAPDDGEFGSVFAETVDQSPEDVAVADSVAVAVAVAMPDPATSFGVSLAAPAVVPLQAGDAPQEGAFADLRTLTLRVDSPPLRPDALPGIDALPAGPPPASPAVQESLLPTGAPVRHLPESTLIRPETPLVPSVPPPDREPDGTGPRQPVHPIAPDMGGKAVTASAAVPVMPTPPPASPAPTAAGMPARPGDVALGDIRPAAVFRTQAGTSPAPMPLAQGGPSGTDTDGNVTISAETHPATPGRAIRQQDMQRGPAPSDAKAPVPMQRNAESTMQAAFTALAGEAVADPTAGETVLAPYPQNVTVPAETVQNRSAPPTPGPLPPQVGPDLLALVKRAPEGAVTLTLRPEDLGTLQFHMTQSPEGLHIHLAVDQPSTLDLLRRHADQLLADLRQAGFAGTTLAFSGGGGDGGARGDRPTPTLPETDSCTATTLPRTRQAAGTLDLRL